MPSMRRRQVIALLPAATAFPHATRAASLPPIAAYERATGGRVGFYASNVATGQVLSWRADERFMMCSTFKASLAALVLRGVDAGQERLDSWLSFRAAGLEAQYAPVARANFASGGLTIGAMCTAAVEQSDNICANSLLDHVGGPAALTAFWRAIGDRETRLDDPEPYLNRTPPGGIRNTTTPAAMAATLQALTLGPVLSPASRAMLLGWLRGCRTGHDRLRAGLPAGSDAGDKTGNNGRDVAADIAVARVDTKRPLIVAAYTRGGSPGAADFDRLFAGIGRAVGAVLG